MAAAAAAADAAAAVMLPAGIGVVHDSESL